MNTSSNSQNLEQTVANLERELGALYMKQASLEADIAEKQQVLTGCKQKITTLFKRIKAIKSMSTDSS